MHSYTWADMGEGGGNRQTPREKGHPTVWYKDRLTGESMPRTNSISSQVVPDSVTADSLTLSKGWKVPIGWPIGKNKQQSLNTLNRKNIYVVSHPPWDHKPPYSPFQKVPYLSKHQSLGWTVWPQFSRFNFLRGCFYLSSTFSEHIPQHAPDLLDKSRVHHQ